jgi:hypothetical protein
MTEEYRAKLREVWFCGPVSEAEFLDVIGTKVLRVFLLAIHGYLY